MDYNRFGVVILAAGKGKRMNSELPKVLHCVNGKTMISAVVNCVADVFNQNIVVVVGHQWEKVKADISKNFDVSYALQKELLGTGDAVKSAIPYFKDHIQDVLILCGDVPLIRKDTVLALADEHVKKKNHVTVLAVDVDDPKGYGRVIVDTNGDFICIREESDASLEEKKINRINTGIYCVDKSFLTQALDLIGKDNVQKEYYLTDMVEIAAQLFKKTGYIIGCDPREVTGVNTKEDLKSANNLGRLMDLELS